ncbi:peptidase C15, pyroglutamyl peptidase I-like protein [Stipitochalara longipes BDJ]|nr:peptidase C15, pyroglutamyl peptidase I-like protein [Stipitochalara longipes BDJ]
MPEEEDEKKVTVLVTGFGAFQDVKINPSWEIASRLPSTINSNGVNVQVIVPPEALKASYHYLFNFVPKLLEQYKPDIVLHIGLAVERDYFGIEKGADRDGYNQYPDADRKVFNKTETKKAWGKSPTHLYASYDFEEVLKKWRARSQKDADLRISDDVGNYVCGFVYYTSLERRCKGAGSSTVFMHVPPLPEKADIEKGVKVTIGLIQALVEIENVSK